MRTTASAIACCVALASAGLTVHQDAVAQPAGSEETKSEAVAENAAQRAFDEGMALMKAERYEEACAKLEESQRIEAGMGTQFRLAQCYEKAGRIASAWRNYEAVARSARDARLRADTEDKKASLQKRETYAQGRADALVAKLARATLRVPKEVAVLSGLTVTIDGIPVPPSGWTNAPIDKGSRPLVVTADGKRPFEATLEVPDDGARVTLDIPMLADAPADAEPTQQPQPAPVVVDDFELSTMSIAGIVVGAAGLAGIGVGVGLGFAAKSKHDESAPFCNGDLCQQEGVDIRDDALTLGNIGTGVFIAGAVVAAGGIGLFVIGMTLDDDEAVEASLSVGPQQMSATLRF